MSISQANQKGHTTQELTRDNIKLNPTKRNSLPYEVIQ